MPTTRLKIDFWDVLGENDKRFEFLDFMAAVQKQKHETRLKERSPEHSDYLEAIRVDKNSAFGRASRLRMTGLPGRFDMRRGLRSPLGLSDSEALDETVYFYFDHSLQTLATQRSGHFRSTSLEELFREVHGGRIELNPKLRKDAWDRLDKMDRITSVDLKLFTPSYNPEGSSSVPSVRKFIQEQRQVANAYTVEMSIGIGRSRKESLTVGYVRDLVRAFVGHGAERLNVSGTSSDSHRRDEIDFLRDRLVFTTDVDYAGRSLEAETCLVQLRRAIDQQKKYLAQLL